MQNDLYFPRKPFHRQDWKNPDYWFPQQIQKIHCKFFYTSPANDLNCRFQNSRDRWFLHLIYTNTCTLFCAFPFIKETFFFHVSFVQIGFNSPSLVIVMLTQLSCLLVQMTIGFSITSWMFIFIWTLLAQVLTVSWTSCRSVLKAFSWFAKPLNKGFIFLNALFRTLTVTLSVFWNRKIENYPACFYIMNIGFLQYSSDISTR